MNNNPKDRVLSALFKAIPTPKCPINIAFAYLANLLSFSSYCLRLARAQCVKGSAATFTWTAIPCRTEWRHSILSPKNIAQDSGHLCQNLYLACEAIGAGTCAIGAYNQEKMDRVPRVDGKEEFAIYVAPVGKQRRVR